MGIYRLIMRFLELGSSLAQVPRCHIVGVSNQPISTAETKRQLKSRKCSNGEIRILSAAASVRTDPSKGKWGWWVYFFRLYSKNTEITELLQAGFLLNAPCR